jgi:hypothetical protein
LNGHYSQSMVSGGWRGIHFFTFSPISTKRRIAR